MLKNYLKLALRNIWSQKLLSSINIFSLAIGLAACLMIYLFIREERSFDNFHTRKQQLYRLAEVQSFPGTNTQQVALSMPGMAPHLYEDYPEVQAYARYLNAGKQVFEKEDQRIVSEQTVIVDSTFLELFDFQLVYGDPRSALDEPHTVLLTRETSEKLFGLENPAGETLIMDDTPYEITGVLENVPENSHLQFDALLSMTTLTQDDPEFNNQFGSNFLVTYLLMDPSTDIPALEAKMPAFLNRYMPPEDNDGQDANDYYQLFFQPLPEVHLASTGIEHDYQNYRKFNGAYLDIFAVVGLFILLIAAFNFMNLVTARAAHRWKEVGVRKVVGAGKAQLFTQFAFESLVYGALAFVFALAIAQLAAPLLYDLTGRDLSPVYFLQHPALLLLAFALTTLLGFLAGIYPAFYLASYDPVRVLQGGDVKNRKSVFRSSLVVLQFGLAIAMIVGTLVVVQQLYFMKNKDVGFDTDQILLVDMDREANQAFETLKEELLKSSRVLGVTASGQRLGNNFHQWGFKIRTDSIRGLTPSNVNVDYDYFDVYGIDIIQGRGFSEAYGTDNGMAYVINESLARELNLEDPVGVAAGHSWYADDSLGAIIGVAEDFHFNSLHHEINTLAMVVHPDWGYDELSVKIEAGQTAAAISEIERTWNELVPGYPFQYTFLDEHFEELYRSDRQMEAVVTTMAILAILIACMGLFGLSAITTERKVKEIGICKILGASPRDIVIRLSKGFLLLIALAFVLFSPLAYWALNGWLEGFAYRIELNPLVFLLGGLLALAIAVLTISYHTLRAARRNPVEALRYE